MVRTVQPDQTILRGVAATLKWMNVDGNGVPTNASGTVAVAVTNAAGSSVTTGTATDNTASVPGQYTFGLTAAQTASVNVYTVTWTDGGDSSAHTTKVEIVGGLIATVAQAKAAHASIAEYADEDVLAKIESSTREVEWICDRSFRPRYRRLTLDGSGERALIVPDNDLISVSAVTVDGTAYTSGQLAELILEEHRTILQPSGSVWPADRANVTIAYSYGMDAAPPDLLEAFLVRVRQKLNAEKSGIPDRATRFAVADLGTIELDQASTYRVGYPDIDAVYSRYSMRSSTTDGQASPRPYARQVDFNPQNGSLFHGGRM